MKEPDARLAFETRLASFPEIHCSALLRGGAQPVGLLSLAGFIQKIPHLLKLGINAVELEAELGNLVCCALSSSTSARDVLEQPSFFALVTTWQVVPLHRLRSGTEVVASLRVR